MRAEYDWVLRDHTAPKLNLNKFPFAVGQKVFRLILSKLSFSFPTSQALRRIATPAGVHYDPSVRPFVSYQLVKMFIPFYSVYFDQILHTYASKNLFLHKKKSSFFLVKHKKLY